MTSRRRCLVAFAFFGLTALSFGGGSAFALDYPTRPVRWVVGYPPGGATDIMARLIGQPAFGTAGPAVRHREQARRRQQHRHRSGRERGARRLHDPAGQPGERDQRDTLRQAELQLHPRHRAGRRHRARAERDDGQPERAGEDRRGVHRLCQGESRQDQHGLVRQRHIGPSLRRAVQGDDRRQHAARALSRRRRRR